MQEGRYLNIRELSQRLSLSPRTLRTRVKDPTDPLPAYRVGGKLLFRWAEVEAWLARHRVQPVDVNEMVNDLLNPRGG
jgi:excisionase family DNA binding protein